MAGGDPADRRWFGDIPDQNNFVGGFLTSLQRHYRR